MKFFVKKLLMNLSELLDIIVTTFKLFFHPICIIFI